MIFALLTWSLARGYFPAQSPHLAGLTAWLAAVATSLAFFASILVHELAHSRVALSHGIPVPRITLFVFGGVAHIGREAASAAVELRVAVAGPLTSGALAVLCWGAGFLVAGVDVLAVALAYLARMNALVALFNLVPGFPLDGGRVLRALVWRWTGDFDRASRADDHLLGALEKLDTAGVAQMPVVNEGRLLGMLGREEILHYIQTRAELGV